MAPNHQSRVVSCRVEGKLNPLLANRMLRAPAEEAGVVRVTGWVEHVSQIAEGVELTTADAALKAERVVVVAA